jgi:methylase of polypeptide subunit release factors
MVDQYELIQQLTSSPFSGTEQRRRLNDFAMGLGWRPSDQLALPGTEEFASGHLVVENGLQNSAVISFLRNPFRYPELDSLQQKKLLNASYNNLIDWHIAVDYDGASFVYNRVDPPRFYSYRKQISRDRVSDLSSRVFDALSTDHPSPNVLALDTALIRTISLWKRQLFADIASLTNEHVSALFNAIILVRAFEDHFRKTAQTPVPTLRERSLDNPQQSIVRLLAEAIGSYRLAIPPKLFDVSQLGPFEALAPAASRELVGDFYRNRYVGYFDYDFSIMSKHALSRIYEHYVSLLRVRETEQESFFPPLPDEKVERQFGNIYTPQFIARFFAKYLQKEVPLSRFHRMSIGDPACGSGIFLRAMLEAKFETLLDTLTTQNISDGFQSVSGIDIDPNACAATRLSLSLLSLVLTGQVPQSLKIHEGDALGMYRDQLGLKESLDVVVANPPFVNIDVLPAERRQLLLDALGDSAKGKTDLYLGILQAGIDFLKPDGFGLFVLPKNFLISENAAPIREKLLKCAVLHCVVDLSAVRVFEEVGAYVILLIFQRQPNPSSSRPVLVVQCSDLAGAALEDALQDREVRTPAYQVYWSQQPERDAGSWEFAPPESIALQSKLAGLPTLSEIAEIRQGIITGMDSVFIRPLSAVPKKEREVYIPFLADREIEPYRVSVAQRRYVIYPFRGDEPLSEEDFKGLYPQTWEYLLSHEAKLLARRSVRDAKNPWWRPVRPREPKMLLRPKIVTPHLVISPRFALDIEGAYAVSHSPYIVPRGPGGRDELLYLLGILNSTPCFWMITQAAHNYSRGYSRLEVATLKGTPIPDPAKLDRTLLREIIRLVSLRLEAAGSDALNTERLLDDRISEAYGLSEKDRRLVGLGVYQ